MPGLFVYLEMELTVETATTSSREVHCENLKGIKLKTGIFCLKEDQDQKE